MFVCPECHFTAHNADELMCHFQEMHEDGQAGGQRDEEGTRESKGIRGKGNEPSSGEGGIIGEIASATAASVVGGPRVKQPPLRVAIAREQHEIADLLRAHGGVVEVGPDSAGTLI